MAINRFLGTATTQAQVDTFIPINVLTGNVFTLTMTGFDGSIQSVSYIAAADTVADVTAGLETAWNANAESNDLIVSLAAFDGTTELTLTAGTAGTAFKVLGTATGGTADITEANTIANGGPSDYQDTNNWSLGTVPGEDVGGDDSEDVFIEDSIVDILYGLNNSGSTYFLKSFNPKRTYTGKIGWNGATGLVGDYLQIKTSKAIVGEFFESGNAAGSGRIKLNLGSTAADVIVYKTASSTDSPKPAFRMLAASDSTDIKEIRAGSVGIASETGETATIGDILISHDGSVGTDATLEIGAGVTMDNLTCIGGETSLKCGIETGGVVLSRAGSLITSGTGTIPTLNVEGGSVKPASSGTITACNITAGVCDFTVSAEDRIVTTLTLSGGTLQYDRDVVDVQSKIEPVTGTGRIQYSSSKI
jgi:hypothetical protein